MSAPQLRSRPLRAPDDAKRDRRAMWRATIADRSDPELLQLLAEASTLRPRTRADCAGGPRPCPWISCRHHLGSHVTLAGGLQLRDPEQLSETCALDVADRGGATLDEVGEALGVTRSRANQIELAALSRLAAALSTEGEG